jgi:hypothetical protein
LEFYGTMPVMLPSAAVPTLLPVPLLLTFVVTEV